MRTPLMRLLVLTEDSPPHRINILHPLIHFPKSSEEFRSHTCRKCQCKSHGLSLQLWRASEAVSSGTTSDQGVSGSKQSPEPTPTLISPENHSDSQNQFWHLKIYKNPVPDVPAICLAKKRWENIEFPGDPCGVLVPSKPGTPPGTPPCYGARATPRCSRPLVPLQSDQGMLCNPKATWQNGPENLIILCIFVYIYIVYGIATKCHQNIETCIPTVFK